jgi:cysteine desulfurase
MSIFLDHNAGSPIRPEAAAAISLLLEERVGNPSSVHRSGQRARRALENSRRRVAELVGANPQEIIFTSGGTESNNLAIEGTLRCAAGHRKIVTTAIEHSSILAPLAYLESKGFEVIRIRPDRDGVISPAEICGAIDQNTALITVGLVNGEVGTIQETGEIASVAAAAGAVFHLDAAQAAGRVLLEARELRCDLMTLSGHKLGTPGGIGALFVREGAALAPVLLGGPQESGRRAGTPNLVGAIAFGAAADCARRAFGAESERLYAMSAVLLSHLTAAIPGLRLNGSPTNRVANTLNLTFPNVLGESMLIALDLEGVEVSMGSACAAGAVEPSHVLIAMGRSPADARSSLRISLGWSTTEKEIATAAEIIPRVWRRVVESEPFSFQEAAS